MVELIDETYVATRSFYSFYLEMVRNMYPIHEVNIVFKDGNEIVCKANIHGDSDGSAGPHDARLKMFTKDPKKNFVIPVNTDTKHIRMEKMKSVNKTKYTDKENKIYMDYGPAFSVFAAGEIRNHKENANDETAEAIKLCEPKFNNLDRKTKERLADVAFGRRDYSEVKAEIRRAKRRK